MSVVSPVVVMCSSPGVHLAPVRRRVLYKNGRQVEDVSMV